MPTWFNPLFLFLHVLVGIGTTLLVLCVPAPWNAVLASLAVIGIHEQTKVSPNGRYFSDFISGEPLNGTLDVLSAVVPALLYALWTLIA